MVLVSFHNYSTVINVGVIAEKGVEELREMLGSIEPPEPLEWVPVVASLGLERKRVRLRSGDERVYISYRVQIPKEVVERLGLHEEATVLLQVARPRWYHLINYREEPFRSRFKRIKSPWIKAEICMLGLAPEEFCRQYRAITVIASEEELKRLGLQPGQLVTLRELLQRARKTENKRAL